MRLTGLGPGLATALGRYDLLNPELHLDLNFPQMIMVSGYHELTDRLAILGDVGWQDWSEFGDLGITVSSTDTTNLTVNENYQDT